MNAVEVNQRPCLEASRLWLKIVVQTHVVVESVKLVLQGRQSPSLHFPHSTDLYDASPARPPMSKTVLFKS